MGIFNLKYRDTRPALQVSLLNPDGSAFDLSALSAPTVTLHVYVSSTAALDKTMSISGDGSTGVVTYSWAAADWTTLTVGDHPMEVEVTDTGGVRITFPNTKDDILRVAADLGQAT